MDLLILGGTAFLSRQIARQAVERGHRVTCVARGSAEPPDGVSFVRADRDEESGLTSLADRMWDSIVDVSRQPGQVRRAVRDLRTRHRVFISSGNVYADFSRIEQGEDSAVLDPLCFDAMETDDDYGPAKVACERIVRAAGPCAVVRSGLIGGPGDDSGRTGYWPWRFAHPVAEHVVAPAEPDFPCAIIDVRDLAAWLVDLAERRSEGVFNATGLTMCLRDVLATAAAISGSTATPVWIAPGRLAESGIGGWMGPASLPLWIADPEWRGFATMDTTRARAAGLVTRPLAETLTDSLVWEEHSRTTPRRCGLSDEDERRVLNAA